MKPIEAKWRQDALPVDEFRHFRWRHHYFRKLRYWDDYKSTFTYLDSKSQGLLAISGAGAVVFAVVVSGASTDTGSVEWILLFPALLGFAATAIASALLVFCLQVTANNNRPDRNEQFRKFETCIPGDGDLHEANIERFIDLFTCLAVAGNDRASTCKQDIDKLWQSFYPEMKDPTVRQETLNDTLIEAVAVFTTLRRDVEKEVERRRNFFKFARFIVLGSIALFLWIVVALFVQHT